MMRWTLRPIKHMLIVAAYISLCATSGCVDSINYLASDSRLPKWFTLPPGLTRADVTVVRASMQPNRHDVNVVGMDVVLYTAQYKRLAEVHGKTIRLGSFLLNVVNGVPEITGYKAENDERGNQMPYFYVVDDSVLIRTLLDENQKKLNDYGFDYSALKEKLLGAGSGRISDH